MIEINDRLTKEQKEHISQVVDRLFRMKRKTAIRKIRKLITYPYFKLKHK
jgi:hypothetical protein